MGVFSFSRFLVNALQMKIVIKLGPLTKPYKRNTTASKKVDDDVMLMWPI